MGKSREGRSIDYLLKSIYFKLSIASDFLADYFNRFCFRIKAQVLRIRAKMVFSLIIICGCFEYAFPFLMIVVILVAVYKLYVAMKYETVEAAEKAFKEMDGVTISEQQSVEKKKGFPDWINLMKSINEERSLG
ncbi:hypothetical protein L1987_49734 [Smallanthus sonchifolius]|uniref:Uncharacterized protein n=1 Tax=Smallanthus sonchifolius TaxID=185202 RepID=A0ACB9FWE6_9ASTR|nr:hypothetical protein L1987_49734 [Smallanthus sonchifolius]